jgi:GTP-binding protein
VLPADESDPAENALTIIKELEQHSEKLINKPRWIVFNKLDLLLEDEAQAVIDKVVAALDYKDRVFSISAFNKQGTEELCNEVMNFIEALPPEEEVETPEEQAVEFKWDTYHQDAMEEVDDLLDDDDWDEDDYDVEVEYRR